MARRYRYSFARKKEAPEGKLSVGLFVTSLVLFVAAVALYLALEGRFGFAAGGICMFAALLSVYGFAMGLYSFSKQGFSHRTGIVGSIANGVTMMCWLGFFLMGV